MREQHQLECLKFFKKCITTQREECGATGQLTYCWWEGRRIQLLWKAVWQFNLKLNILPPFNPAIALLGLYPKEMKTYVHIKTCSEMFIASVLVIVPKLEKHRYPLIAE